MIKLKNIHKRFGISEVLKGIDLEIQRGEIVVIIGSSGTGKSTLLRCVNFLEQADQGSIRIDELTVDTQKHTKADVLALRRKTGFVFQNYALFAHLTARQNIAEALITVRGWKKLKRTNEHSKFSMISALAIKVIAIPQHSLAASSNGLGLAARWRCNLNCCCSMNRPPPSILNGWVKCWLL